jgi:hypothetical protein
LVFPKNVDDSSKGRDKKRELAEEVKAVERVFFPDVACWKQ